MPNHETNHVVVIGTEEQIKTLLEATVKPSPSTENGHFFDFDGIVPSPPNKETGGCSGKHAPGVVCWYAWNIDNWGTKWGAYDFDHEGMTLKVADLEAGLHLLYFTFQTAWSAPTPVFAAMEEEKFGVEVHAWTEDEGGFPPQVYGEPDLYLDIQGTKLVYDESIGEYGDDRPATQAEIDADEAYTQWEVELRD